MSDTVDNVLENVQDSVNESVNNEVVVEEVPIEEEEAVEETEEAVGEEEEEAVEEETEEEEVVGEEEVNPAPIVQVISDVREILTKEVNNFIRISKPVLTEKQRELYGLMSPKDQ